MLSNPPLYDATVIVPTYNRCELLDLTLASLARQRVNGHTFEVIVVDDGSSDQTFQMLRENHLGLAIKYIFQPDAGYRPCRARNLGLRAAEGRICIFVDSGNLLCKDFVEAHLRTHDTSSREIATTGYLYGFHQTDEFGDLVLASLDVHDVDASIERMATDERLHDAREKYFHACDDKIDRYGMAWALFSGGNISLRREFAWAIGGFDEWHKSWGADDIDFGLAASRHGARFVLSRAAAVIQYPHAKDAAARQRSRQRNVEHLCAKYDLPPALMEGPFAPLIFASISDDRYSDYR